MKKIIQYMCAVAGLLLMLLSCQDDAMIINPDVTHGQSTEGVETANGKGTLNSTLCPESKIVLLSIGDPTLEGRDETDLGRKDELCLILPKPLEKDITLKIAMEDAYANNETMKNGGSYTSFVVETFRREYKIKTQGSDFNIPGNNGLGNTLSLNGGKEAIVTIRAGERKSEKVKLLFEREYLSSNYTYLFPIQAVEVETGELIDQIYYIISPVEDQKEIGEKPGTVIAYIDTEVMNPLIAAQFSLSVDFFDMSEGFEETNIYKGPLLDILNVRTAFLKEVQGHAALTYTTDMEYVLKNHSHTSYAKLIKALKNAMPGKLLTLVDTRETTEALCDEQAGISVGNYLDYAWSSLEDFLAPYEPDATIRPLAGIPEKKYGTIFLRDIAAMSQEEQVDLMENSIIGEYMNMMRFTPLSGTDVVVGADIPYMDYGKESVWNDPWATWILCKYPAPEDFSSSTMAQTEVPYSVRDYYMFQKDW